MVRRTRDYGSRSTTRVNIVATVAVAVLTMTVSAVKEFEPRSFNGTGNNLASPEWGSVGSVQIRSMAGADYADDALTPPGNGRPTAREVTSDVFLASSAAVSAKSALFVAWGQLLTYDISFTIDNSTEPFDVPCNDVVDVWCPLGASSDEILFDRSYAGMGNNSVRSPINYATAYIDLDFVYGRNESEAEALRTLEGGMMNVTDSGVPFRNADGTWLIADQRPAQFPVTFALHTMLLLEHNRCCVEVAPYLGYEGDEGIYQACRGWTIAAFQHVTEKDFLILLLGDTISNYSDEYESWRRLYDVRESSYDGEEGEGKKAAAQENADYTGFAVNSESTLEENTNQVSMEQRVDAKSVPYGGALRGERLSSPGVARSRRGLPDIYSDDDFDDSINVGADVFFTTVAAAALESSLPATVRVLSEGYVSTDDDNIELVVARDDMAGLFERNDVGGILRGAALSSALSVNTYYVASVTNLSPLFKLPVDAVQRGRDHGLPTYNAAREAYGLSTATNFSEVTSDVDLAALLSNSYGGDIDNLDAITGALAESSSPAFGSMLGELLHASWVEQLSRTIEGDRLHHLHDRPIEDMRLTTLSGLIERTTNVTDLPLAVFTVPGVTICGGNCEVFGQSEATLSDSFAISWEFIDDENIAVTLRAKGIGSEGMMGIGWGGTTMYTAQDYAICEVLSEDEAECIDRSTVSSRRVPSPDDVDPSLTVTSLTVGEEWTTVTFVRPTSALDDQDYDLGQDIDEGVDTDVIYSYRKGAGVGQHPNANRGAAAVNFATGDVETECDDNLMFVSLHGALMLVAWLLVAPLGIYFIRYRKGDTIRWAGGQWYEVHEELMIVASEAVLPLGITAVFASGGNHRSNHARWGYYMISAVVAQIYTGWMRTKGLEAKHANFSFLHRCNKYFHIWAGRFAYVAGVIQCYRGLELVSADENLVFSAGHGLDLKIGNFGNVKDYVFPMWFAVIAVCGLVFEGRKQYYRYFSKGAAKSCGCLEVVNDEYYAKGNATMDRLMPRTERAPLYTVAEFNDKVLSGQSWVLVDGAILDVLEFSHRHPGGARLILNAVGTDITHELLGGDNSIGHAVSSFTPHSHPESAWEIARSLVIGYLDEEEGQQEQKTSQELPEPAGNRVRGVVLGKKLRVAVNTKTALLPPRKGSLGGDLLAKKASRLNELAAVPELGASALDFSSRQQQGEKRMPSQGSWSTSGSLLERFHVCPLLFRERLGGSGEDYLLSDRPVYRYVFQCPGPAQALVQAITGVCYVNMQAQDGGKGVIQRAYNAYAVRVQGLESTTSGRERVDDDEAGGLGAGKLRILPARETSEGMLCVETRIRLYPDGAMSKLLEELASSDSKPLRLPVENRLVTSPLLNLILLAYGQHRDNPAVRLQGPFVIQKLVPPPVHRNVVMIAAGTGINPMVQQIRDYMASSGSSRTGEAVAGRPSRARLVLLWQATHLADLYGFEEIRAMQARSDGQLEATVLISGDHRRVNIPGSTFRNKAWAARGDIVEPYLASPSPVSEGSNRLDISVSISQRDNVEGGEAKVEEGVRLPKARDTFFAAPNTSNGVRKRRAGASKRGWSLAGRKPMVSERPSRKISDTSQSWLVGRGFLHGKVTRGILEDRFGPALLTTLAAFNRGGLDAHTEPTRREGTTDGTAGETKGYYSERLDALCGTEATSGELQVAISGPAGFVSYVETLLKEMGVPPESLVLLD